VVDPIGLAWAVTARQRSSTFSVVGLAFLIRAINRAEQALVGSSLNVGSEYQFCFRPEEDYPFVTVVRGFMVVCPLACLRYFGRMLVKRGIGAPFLLSQTGRFPFGSFGKCALPTLGRSRKARKSRYIFEIGLAGLEPAT
jgi:hypothetical protein